MQPSHSSAEREGQAGGDGVTLLLPAVAALLWVMSIMSVLWLEDHPDAPTELGVSAVVLVMVVMPAAFGAAVSWCRHARAHQGRTSAWAGALAGAIMGFAGGAVAVRVRWIAHRRHS